MATQNPSKKTTLLIAVRGWTDSDDRLLGKQPGGEIKKDFVTALEQNLHATEVWAPDLEMGMFSMHSAEAIAQDLFEKIDEKIAKSPNIERIILLGYSAGSLLARRVFCMAHGASADGKVKPVNRVAWADKIDRIVMLAGITRGWEFSSASPAHVRFFAPLLLKLTSVIGWYKTKKTGAKSGIPFIWQLKRGSPFVISTRIQYINVFEELQKRQPDLPDAPLRAERLPSTVFVVGAKDEYISPSDCTELGPRIEFAFIELSGSNHIDALQIAGNNNENRERRVRLKSAIADSFASIYTKPWAVPANDIDDYLEPMDIVDIRAIAANQTPPVTHAVMIVHGIRDNGFWTKRVAREVKTLARSQGKSVRAPTPSYGYFSMWDFIKPGGREQAAYWFMERYADVKSHFPTAKISFIGHSNGTYIAARSLELCPAIEFDNVVFAGSVVKRGFRWSRFPGRVRRILNFVGSKDGVVAFLPAVFELLHLRWLDVGGAGAFGFLEAEPEARKGHVAGKQIPSSGTPPIELSELRFIPGGHGAATEEEFWREIANFALGGNPPQRKPYTRKALIEFLFHCAPAITIVGMLLMLLLLTSPLTVAALTASWVIANAPPTSLAITVTVAAVTGSLFVSWLAGRFLKMW